MPAHFETAVRSFLQFATYQAERPFFRHGHPMRFVPTSEELGVTMTVLFRERVVEIGLFGTEHTCRHLAQVLTGLAELSLADTADALGEQMNLVAGRLSYGAESGRQREHIVQLGLPNVYSHEQCATYRTQVIPLVAQRIGCEGLSDFVCLTASERTPYHLMNEALALLELGDNRMALSSVVALLDEFRELDENEDKEELKLIEHCKKNLVKRINGGQANLERLVTILGRVRTARAPFDAGDIPGSVAFSGEQVSVEGEDLSLVLEFISEGREAVDAVDGIMMLAERGGVTSPQVTQLFRLFHSLKGTAGMVGVRPVVELAHGTETLLAAVRDDGRRFDKRVIDFIFASSSLIRRQVELAYEATTRNGWMSLVPGFQEHSARLATLNAGEDVECLDVAALLDEDAPTPNLTTMNSESVRVDIRTIERVNALVRGLSLVKKQLAQDEATGIENLTRVQDKLLQLGNEMALVSCQTIFSKTSRLVRDLSRTLGKMVQVSFEGAEYRVSRAILGALGDPLTHVLRNSLDHGIETPEQRRQTDKPALATVFVRVDFEDDWFVLQVGDDGRGIDGAAVLRIAQERGLVPDGAELTWQEQCALIFAPGFSTASEVSDISGRGVGLDVVKTVVEGMGGELRVESELGRGTTFFLRVPMNRFSANAGGFEDSLEVLLLDDAPDDTNSVRVGEVGWF